MRVTHVITRLIVGGAQENTLSSVLGLRERPGLEVDLISGPTHGSEGSLEHCLENIPGALTVTHRRLPVKPLPCSIGSPARIPSRSHSCAASRTR